MSIKGIELYKIDVYWTNGGWLSATCPICEQQNMSFEYIFGYEIQFRCWNCTTKSIHHEGLFIPANLKFQDHFDLYLAFPDIYERRNFLRKIWWKKKDKS